MWSIGSATMGQTNCIWRCTRGGFPNDLFLTVTNPRTLKVLFMTSCSQVSQLIKGLLSSRGYKLVHEVNLCYLSLIINGTVSHK